MPQVKLVTRTVAPKAQRCYSMANTLSHLVSLHISCCVKDPEVRPPKVSSSDSSSGGEAVDSTASAKGPVIHVLRE